MTKTVRVPGDLFAKAGAAIYGDEWTGPLARALGINLRTVQRWKEAAARGEDYQVSRTLLAEVQATFTREAKRLQGRAGDCVRAAHELHQLLVDDARGR